MDDHFIYINIRVNVSSFFIVFFPLRCTMGQPCTSGTFKIILIYTYFDSRGVASQLPAVSNSAIRGFRRSPGGFAVINSHMWGYGSSATIVSYSGANNFQSQGSEWGRLHMVCYLNVLFPSTNEKKYILFSWCSSIYLFLRIFRDYPANMSFWNSLKRATIK